MEKINDRSIKLKKVLLDWQREGKQITKFINELEILHWLYRNKKDYESSTNNYMSTYQIT